MAKIRIHALAKELGVPSKDVVAFLTEKKIEVKSAQSSVEGDVIDLVKTRFTKAAAPKSEGEPKPKPEGRMEPAASRPKPKQEGKPEPKPEGNAENMKDKKTEGKPEGKPEMKSEGKPEAQAEAATKDEGKSEAKGAPKTEERPKKKSSITAVFNPQNSKMGGRRGKGQRQGGRGDRTGGRSQNQGQNANPNQNASQKRHQIPARSASERAEAVKAKFDKILGVEKPAAPKPEAVQKPQADLKLQELGQKPAETGRMTVDESKRGMESGSGTLQGRVLTETGKGTEQSRSEAGRTENVRGTAQAGTRTVEAGRVSNQAEKSQQEKAPQQERSERSGGNVRSDRAGSGSRMERGERSGGNVRSDRAGGSSRSDRRDNGVRTERTGSGSRMERGERSGGNVRSDRAGGARPERSDRPAQNRFGNDRGNRNERTNNRNPQNSRANSGRAQGDRNGQRSGNNRAKEPRNRFEQEINKMNQNAPVTEELRKESRDNRRGGGGSQKPGRERNSGPKKQERFTNLEKNGGKKKRPQPAPAPVEKEEVIKTIILPESVTIKELADKMKVQASAIVKKLFMQGTMVTVNQEIEFEKAEEIALEYNCICELEEKVDVIEELLKEEAEDESKMVKRPPVVCVMGHVDHGKTSLLDAIRNTHVIDREAGGITQHIGAYMVTCNGEKITFLDTPGHEAFTAMRMRGANSTDIAILVVAADDGVMPQTVEAISHAKAAGVEIIVAINKVDKPSANIERVKQELSEYELIPEDWGGSTIFVPVSAHTHEGIDNLLEMILLTAEVMELKANPKRLARGLVIEAQLDKGRGTVATVLVQKGTLKVGQPIAAGSCSGKVRAMIDDQGRRVKEAGPSTPVEILGLNNVPNAGEVFVSTETEKEAKSFADTFISQGREKLLEDTKSKMSLDDLFSQIQSGNVKELGIIVKADVQGSVEAVKQSLLKLSNEEVVVKIIHGGVGAINESDVSLASASNAIIIGFNVRPDAQAKASAEREGVDLRLYKVIYNAIEDVQAAMKGMLDPIFEEKVLGHGEVRQIFKASGIGNIAGSYVLDGVFQRGCKVRISREGEQIFEGNLASLKRFKDDVKEVRAGYECGLVFEGFNEIQELDLVEAYTMVEVPR